MTAQLILATMPRHPDAMENLSFILIGFFFVVLMLAILGSITGAIGLFFRRALPKPAQVASASKPAPAPADDSGEDPLALPIIAAAVHSALGGRPHRIMNVQKKNDGWAREGRRQIFSSHKVR